MPVGTRPGRVAQCFGSRRRNAPENAGSQCKPETNASPPGIDGGRHPPNKFSLTSQSRSCNSKCPFSRIVGPVYLRQHAPLRQDEPVKPQSRFQHRGEGAARRLALSESDDSQMANCIGVRATRLRQSGEFRRNTKKLRLQFSHNACGISATPRLRPASRGSAARCASGRIACGNTRRRDPPAAAARQSCPVRRCRRRAAR